MKLKNKKTGEIVEATDFNIISDYNSLAELNADWEDALEKPKEYYSIDENGIVICKQLALVNNTATKKEIGNYFSTREEAEKTVEKLKAWRRLKDKGLKFIDFNFLKLDDQAIINIYAEVKNEYIYEDLLTLFGGKE